jgi:hypothetical protein
MTAPALLPPRWLVRAVLAFRRCLLRLADSLVPPQLPLFEHATGLGRTHMLAAAARLRLADLLAGGPVDADTLAGRTGHDPDALARMLRALAAAGVFVERSDGRFANNRVSRGLLGGRADGFRDFAEYFGSPSNVRAWSDFARTLETGRNAFERVHNMSVWDWFDRNPDERDVFAAAMASMTTMEAPGVARAYPFAEVRRVCDVAGSQGALLAEVLALHPHLTGVLFDNAGVLKSARPLLEARGVVARVELQAGSFFEGVPGGCDAYLLKNILHDWDDARSLAILGNCRRAMQPGTRLLVVELMRQTRPATAIAPMSDVQMMMVCSEGRERSREDFHRLFEQAGFSLTRVLPTQGLMSIVEGIAA